MFVADFNLKSESFGCTKKNTPGPMLKNNQKQLNLIYLNNDEHTHMDRSNGNTDLLDMAFIFPNLAKDDIQFTLLCSTFFRLILYALKTDCSFKNLDPKILSSRIPQYVFAFSQAKDF